MLLFFFFFFFFSTVFLCLWGWPMSAREYCSRDSPGFACMHACCRCRARRTSTTPAACPIMAPARPTGAHGKRVGWGEEEVVVVEQEEGVGEVEEGVENTRGLSNYGAANR